MRVGRSNLGKIYSPRLAFLHTDHAPFSSVRSVGQVAFAEFTAKDTTVYQSDLSQFGLTMIMSLVTHNRFSVLPRLNQHGELQE